MHNKFHIHSLSPRKYSNTVLLSIFLSLLIVAAASMLGRATHNFDAALIEKPDVAIYLLLPEEKLTTTTLLRESENQRDYLAQTKDGPKLIQLKKGDKEWFVGLIEPLHR